VSEPRRTCPVCSEGLHPGGRYCTRCGLEARQLCPTCAEGPRWLASMGAESSCWCVSCDALLLACEVCGRWLPASVRHCPDQQCGGRVVPFHPQHTGRRWDGRGDTAAWRWPEAWERTHPQARPPECRAWHAAGPVHAALVAHGALFLWERTSLVAPDEEAGWLEGEAVGGEPAREVEWRCPLGPRAQPPEAMPFRERAAVAGAAAVLALEQRYLLVDLGRSGDAAPLLEGRPLAQCGAPGWWAGWIEEGGQTSLRCGAVGDQWDSLAPQGIAAPPEAGLAPRGRLVIRDGRAFWPGSDGGIWTLECGTGKVERALDPIPAGTGLPVEVWAEEDGPRAVWEELGQLTAGLSVPQGGRTALRLPAGSGPLRGVHATPEWVLVTGERVTLFDRRKAQRMAEALRPPGRWIDGAAALSEKGQVRLLALTVEEPATRLTSVQPATGVAEIVWDALGLEPRGLLAAGEELYVAHGGGVVRLRDRPGAGKS
jgi:hypothetical protein